MVGSIAQDTLTMRAPLPLMLATLLLSLAPFATAQPPEHDLAATQFPAVVHPPMFSFERSSATLRVVAWNNGTSTQTVTFEASVVEPGAWNGTPHSILLTPPASATVPPGGRAEGNLTANLSFETPESHYNVTIVARWSDGGVASLTRQLTVRDDWYLRVEDPTNATYRSPEEGWVDVIYQHAGPNDHDHTYHYEVVDAPAGRDWSGTTGPLRAAAGTPWTQLRVPLRFADAPNADESGEYRMRLWYFTEANVRHDVEVEDGIGQFVGYEFPIDILGSNATIPPKLTASLVSAEIVADANGIATIEVDVRAGGEARPYDFNVHIEPEFPMGSAWVPPATQFGLLSPGETQRMRFEIGIQSAPEGQHPVNVTISQPGAAPIVLRASLRYTPSLPTVTPVDEARWPFEAIQADLAANPAAALAVGAGGVSLVALVLARRQTLRYALWIGALPLYTRIARPALLADEHRGKAHALIAARPGVHIDEIRRALGLSFGATVHHLRMLERQGYVTSRREGRLRRYYVAGAAPTTSTPSPTSMQDQILGLLAGGPLTRPEIASKLGLSQQGVSYHVKNLERAGRVVIVRVEGEQRVQRVVDAVVALPEEPERTTR